jgi:hypothetical protein
VCQKALILVGCALLSACSHNRALGEEAEVRIDVCGVMVSKNGQPVSRALVELHELPKDTLDDVKANRYELAQTDENGSFRLRVTADRQYWLAVAGTHWCQGLSMQERESRRLAIIFRAVAGGTVCQANINIALDSGCHLKVE